MFGRAAFVSRSSDLLLAGGDGRVELLHLADQVAGGEALRLDGGEPRVVGLLELLEQLVELLDCLLELFHRFSPRLRAHVNEEPLDDLGGLLGFGFGSWSGPLTSRGATAL